LANLAIFYNKNLGNNTNNNLIDQENKPCTSNVTFTEPGGSKLKSALRTPEMLPYVKKKDLKFKQE
jgi:hypothetical protein